jgi:hypothetical protein
MCTTFDNIFSRYIAGVRAGEAAYKLQQRHDPMSAEHYAARCIEAKAHVKVKTARLLIESHKHDCPDCRHLLTARMTARKPAEVDPAELMDLPLLEMIAEAG